jgi:murein DD-endopeptidase MepM/ murein hydrolase activator NlpD
VKRRLVALFVLTGVLAAVGASVGAGIGTGAKTPVASASAYAISVVVPGQAGAGAGTAVAPGEADTGLADSFVYPADGSIVRTGALSSSVSARTDSGAAAQAVTDVLGVALFGGEITFDSAAARARASGFEADAAGSAVVNLVVAGQPVTAAANQQVALGDWGTLVTLEQAVERTTGAGESNARAAVTALRVTLTAEHAGLPAGSEILIGHAESAVTAPVTPIAPAKPAAKPKPGRPTGVAGPKKQLPKPPEPRPRGPGLGGAKVQPAPTDISAPLSPGGYVFPVYGPSSFGDTYGAPRAAVTWHHGQDIFAPLGAPLLAVADGTVFSVGWNDIGGFRFWLRDRAGNQFYYAHLSAFSPLAVNGNEVRAGDVIGFVGNTGDAQGTPYHVHFEIHPVALLPLGYDGVVNPFAYLTAWRHLEDVSFAAGRGWAPPVPATASAPRPGAFLLGSTDISSASGLEPGSLERALVAPVSAEGDGALVRSAAVALGG